MLSSSIFNSLSELLEKLKRDIEGLTLFNLRNVLTASALMPKLILSVDFLLSPETAMAINSPL